MLYLTDYWYCTIGMIKSRIPQSFYFHAKIIWFTNNWTKNFDVNWQVNILFLPLSFYCVYKAASSSCSKGMKEGSVKWDDEDTIKRFITIKVDMTLMDFPRVDLLKGSWASRVLKPKWFSVQDTEIQTRGMLLY